MTVRKNFALCIAGFCCVILSFSSNVSAQNVKHYKLKYQLEVPLLTISAATLSTSYILSRNNTAPTSVELGSLKRDDVWRLERNSTYRWSPRSARASDFLWAGSFAMPGLLLISGNVRNEKYTIALMYLETMSLTMGVTNVVKEIAQRHRPYLYNTDVSDSEKTGKSTARSFFSGHTSECAAASFFTATVYSQMHPNSRFKPLVWSAAAALPAATGILRYTAGRHFTSDVIVGYAVGAAIGMIVPHLHYRRAAKNETPELKGL